MTRLDDLRNLYLLKKLNDGPDKLDTNSLEQDFLTFSRYCQGKVLCVQPPKLYPLQGDQPEQVRLALEALGITAAAPESIDVSGAFDRHTLDDIMIFVSLQQITADHYESSRSYLHPLIEKIYTTGAQLVRDFAVNEVLVGRVVRKCGKLDLKEAHLFPEKFSCGPYKLSVELDTPAKTVNGFMHFIEMIGDFEAAPQNILAPQKIGEAVKSAVSLRTKLGSLSRYDRPSTQSFEAETNSCVVRDDVNTFFYLYSPECKTNILVYFGESPFAPGRQPKELLVLRGKEHQYSLAKLVELGVFKPSPAVLQERIAALDNVYESVARSSGTIVCSDEFGQLRKELVKAQKFYEGVHNEEMRRQFVARAVPEGLEFMVYPATNDPIVHELLPRLSWNKAVRLYHNSDRFIKKFESGDETVRKQMLDELASCLMFSNQQNNAVNLWLYNNHNDFCVREGIVFDVKSS